MKVISLKYVLIRYWCLHIFVWAILMAFHYISDLFFNYSPHYILTSAASAIVPALNSGKTIFNRWHIKLRNGQLWMLSLYFMLGNFTFAVLSMAVFLQKNGSYITLTNDIFFLTLAVGMFLHALMGFFLTRISLSIGMWQAENAHLKQTKDVF